MMRAWVSLSAGALDSRQPTAHSTQPEKERVACALAVGCSLLADFFRKARKQLTADGTRPEKDRIVWALAVGCSLLADFFRRASKQLTADSTQPEKERVACALAVGCSLLAVSCLTTFPMSVAAATRRA